jgi:AcrR family transcriptional regulator
MTSTAENRAQGARRLSREDWVDAALSALAEGGIEGVRLDRLCRHLGVTKGSFYWHFDGREALLDAVADYWAEEQPVAAIATLEAMQGDAVTRLARMEQIVDRLDVGRRDHAMRAWAAADERAAKAVGVADAKILAFVEAQLRALGLEDRDVFDFSRILFFTAIGTYTAPELASGDSRTRISDRLLALIRERSGDVDP